MTFALTKFALCCAAFVVLIACSGLRTGLPVRGAVGGQAIETHVDSEVARYFLANYLGGKRNNAALDDRIDQVYRSLQDGLPDRGELKRLSDHTSVDFAALFFADRIAQSPANSRFRRDFDKARAYVRTTLPEGRLKLPVRALDYEVMFVPGYLYKRHPVTGADFAGPRAALQRVGLRHFFVQTDEEAAIEANADIVVKAIRERAASGRRVIVVSVSKSGPEVALALSRLGSRGSHHVAAWVNIAGTLQGSPLADKRLWQDLEELIGQVDIAGVESLTTQRSRQRFRTFHIPAHVLVVSYIGIPLTGSLSSLARMGFLDLRAEGPNDGLSLLPDLIAPSGLTLADLGRDHFLLDEETDVRTVALAITLIHWLENPDSQIFQTSVTDQGPKIP